jgi:hypothetical protein
MVYFGGETYVGLLQDGLVCLYDWCWYYCFIINVYIIVYIINVYVIVYIIK